jgi:hypothetical protein
MNWQHGLFRLWLLATAAWMVLWAVLVRMACHLLPNGDMTCRTASDHWIAEWINRTTWTYLKIGLVGFSLPVAVLIVGAIVAWAIPRRD